MDLIKFSRLTVASVFLFFLHLTVDAEFVYHPQKANLTFHFENNEWVLTNTSSTKTYLKFTAENAYVQIINDEIRVYKLSEGLWNAHPSAKFLNRLRVSFTEAKIETHPTRFDAYSSFWISSSGGHIRIFRYYEKIKGHDINGKETTHINNFNANHLFLNQNSLSHIKSVNTIFMISPQRNIFEIDPQQKIWRFILLNRNLTPWSSEPPTEKMMFHIFKREDFKKINPLGSKNGKYYVQIIDHKNKMGIATISQDYFQIEYLIPPQFDFISPSLKSDYHLIYNQGKLGIAYFEETKSEHEIPMIRAAYTDAKTQLYASGDENTSAPLLSDHQQFLVKLHDTIVTSNKLTANMHFGLEIINPDLLLYNEYTPSGSISHSGLFRVSQNRWYLAPKQKQLLRYPNAILSLDVDKKSNQLAYSTYSLNGDKRQTDVTDKSSQAFFQVASILTQLPIDTIAAFPKYDTYTYAFRSEEKWGVLQIIDDQFTVVLPPTYDWIDHFGFSKALVLAKDNTFGWYGENLCQPNKPKLTNPNGSSLTLYQGNSTQPDDLCKIGPNYQMSIDYFNTYYIYNSSVTSQKGVNQNAWLRARLQKENLISANVIRPIGSFFQVINGTQTKLYTQRLKEVETPAFDSLYSSGTSVVLFHANPTSNVKQITKSFTSSHKVVMAFTENKKISTSKFSAVYFFKNHFIANKKGLWIILNAQGQSVSDQTFSQLEDAIKNIK